MDRFRLYKKKRLESGMKIFKVRLHWRQIIEKVYEYVISDCETFFDVQNSDDLIFKIIPDNDKKTLMIALYQDNSESEVQAIIESKNFELTGMEYKKIITNPVCPTIKFSNSKKWLPDNEIRYLNYQYNEVAWISFTIISKIRKLKKYHVNITYDNDIVTYYFSKRFFNLADLNDMNVKISDISDDIADKFL